MRRLSSVAVAAVAALLLGGCAGTRVLIDAHGRVQRCWTPARDWTASCVADLQREGYVEVPGVMLGIALDYAADPPRARRVLADSPAARAGIRPGDALLAIAAAPIKTPRDVATALGAARPGDVVRVRLRRDGTPLELYVPVAAHW